MKLEKRTSSVEGSVTRGLSAGPEWLGREESNLEIADPESAALPFGYAAIMDGAGNGIRTRDIQLGRLTL